METEVVNFWKRHRVAFAAMISQRYPLTEELVSRFKNKLVPEMLAMNIRVDWSEDLMLRFEGRTFWTRLIDNPTIPWTEELVRIGVERAGIDNWLFLARERAAWYVIHLFPEKCHSEDDEEGFPFADMTHRELLALKSPPPPQAPMKKWEHIDCQNAVILSENLIDKLRGLLPKFDVELSEEQMIQIRWPDTFVDEMRNYLNWEYFSANPYITWSPQRLLELEPFLEFKPLACNPGVWEDALEGALDDEIITRILEDQKIQKF